MSEAIDGIIVHHDAYYACNWKKLVSDAQPTEGDITIEDSDTKWPLLREELPTGLAGAEDPLFDEENVPTNMGSAFAITGETYRAIEAAGDPSSVLKYFRPLIIYWSRAKDNEDVTRIFDNRNGYKVSTFSPPAPGYPHYRITFNFMGLKPSLSLLFSPDQQLTDESWESYLTVFSYIPDPGEFYSQPDLKEDSAAPIPFIELESLESLDFMTDPKTDFPTMLDRAIAETADHMATSESIDDLTVIYAGISHVVPLPNLNQDFLNQLPKSVRDSWSLSRGNPFIRLQIIQDLVKNPRLSGSLGPYPVNEIYGGGQDEDGSVMENSYNDDLIPEITSLVKIVEELVSNGVLASLDIYSY
jgi:hypothetical protein